MTPTKLVPLLLSLALVSCGGGGGHSELPTDSKTPTIAQSDGLASIFLDVAGHDTSFGQTLIQDLLVAHDGSVDQELVERLLDDLQPRDRRLMRSRIENLARLGSTTPSVALVERCIFHAVRVMCLSPETSRWQTQLFEMLPGVGVDTGTATTLTGVFESGAIFSALLPEMQYGSLAREFLEADAQSLQLVFDLSSVALSERIEALNVATQGFLDGSVEPKQLEVARQEVFFVAAGSRLLMDAHPDGGDIAGELIDATAKTALGASSLATILPGNDPAATQARFFGSIGRFFGDSVDAISEGIGSAVEWVGDRASDIGGIIRRLLEQLGGEGGIGIEIDENGQVGLAFYKQPLESTQVSMAIALSSMSQRLGGLQEHILQQSQLLSGIEQRLLHLVERFEVATSAILDAVQGVHDTLLSTRSELLAATDAIRVDIAAARTDVAELREIIVWWAVNEIHRSMEEKIVEYEQEVRVALDSIDRGDRSSLLVAISRMLVLIEQAPRTTFVQGAPIDTIVDCLSWLTTEPLEDQFFGEVSMGVAQRIGELLRAPVLASQIVNPGVQGMLASRFVEVVDRAQPMLGSDLNDELGFVAGTLNAARRDAIRTVSTVVDATLERARQVAPLASQEFAGVCRAVAAELGLRQSSTNALAQEWLEVGRWAEEGELLLPLHPLELPTVFSLATPVEGAWNYELSGVFFELEGDDLLQVLLQSGLLQIREHSSGTMDLDFAIPSRLQSVSAVLGALNGKRLGKIRIEDLGQGTRVIHVTQLDLQLRGIPDLQVFCADTLAELPGAVIPNFLSPVLADPSSTPSLQELAGLVSILRWSLAQVQSFVREDPELAQAVTTLVNHPLLMGSRLFGLASQNSGDPSAAFQSSVADHVERSMAASDLAAGTDAVADLAVGLPELVRTFSGFIDSLVMPRFRSGDFYFNEVDEVLDWVQRLSARASQSPKALTGR